MSNEYIGRQSAVGISVEAVRGTAETSVQKWIRKVSANIIPRSEVKNDDTSFGVLEDSDRRRTVRQWNEGDLNGILHVDVIGYLFANIYGEVTSGLVSGSATVYDHVFTLEQSIVHPSLTMFVKDGAVRQAKIAGAVINTLEISAATDDFIRFTAGFTGKAETTDASAVSYDTEYDFISRDIVVKIADTEAGLVGASALKVKSLNLSWDTGAIPDFTFGSKSPDDIYNGRMSIEGSFTRNYNDQVFETLYKGDTAKYMQITITGEANLDNGSRKPTITILLFKVMVTDWNRSDDADALAEEEVSFKAYYNSTDEAQSEVTLRNLTDSYIQGS